jgi:hypothetical protein
VPREKDNNVIHTKWVFINKLDEDGQIVRYKARLVCKRYAQVEGIEFEETFFFSYKIRINQNVFGICMFQELQSLSSGCQFILFKWKFRRQSIY